MLELYPPIEYNFSDFLQVDTEHNIYFEESGNPQGVPVLCVHGGPGGGCSPIFRRYFNPKLYRIILVDQRGAGKSLPHASLNNNTTQDLISDFEKIREHLNIKQWHLFGGSWGSTLALLYAQAYSEKVISLTLRGIFVGRQEDIDWLYIKGTRQFFPEVHEEFINHLSNEEQHNIIPSYYKRLTSTNSEIRKNAAIAWSVFETKVSRLIIDDKRIEDAKNPFFAEAFARIECHYFMNQCFISANQILDNMAKITHIPCNIIHGRYDSVCKPEAAFELKSNYPQAKLIFVQAAGHSMTEKNMISHLIQSTNEFSLL